MSLQAEASGPRGIAVAEIDCMDRHGTLCRAWIVSLARSDPLSCATQMQMAAFLCKLPGAGQQSLGSAMTSASLRAIQILPTFQ